MPSAEWSGKGAVEHKQHVCLTAKIREVERLAFVIRQGEIGGWGIDGYFGHKIPNLNLIVIYEF
jgi:hypothetical protein